MSARAAASDRSAVARSSSRKLVTLGCGSQPTSASAAASLGRSASTRATFASISVVSSSAAATTVAEMVPIDPGGR